MGFKKNAPEQPKPEAPEQSQETAASPVATAGDVPTVLQPGSDVLFVFPASDPAAPPVQRPAKVTSVCDDGRVNLFVFWDGRNDDNARIRTGRGYEDSYHAYGIPPGDPSTPFTYIPCA